MNRCVVAGLVALAATMAVPAFAQVPRSFPPQTLRGELVVTWPPEARLNGQPARLAPGARIRGENNMLVMSGAVAGQPLVVHYTIDSHGLVKDVWILTPEERARRPWPTTAAEARSWRFDPGAQTWSRP